MQIYQSTGSLLLGCDLQHSTGGLSPRLSRTYSLEFRVIEMQMAFVMQRRGGWYYGSTLWDNLRSLCDIFTLFIIHSAQLLPPQTPCYFNFFPFSWFPLSDKYSPKSMERGHVSFIGMIMGYAVMWSKSTPVWYQSQLSAMESYCWL